VQSVAAGKFCLLSGGVVVRDPENLLAANGWSTGRLWLK
jgi:hypothetical protein